MMMAVIYTSLLVTKLGVHVVLFVKERIRNHSLIIYKVKDKFVNMLLQFSIIFIDLVTSNKHI